MGWLIISSPQSHSGFIATDRNTQPIVVHLKYFIGWVLLFHNFPFAFFDSSFWEEVPVLAAPLVEEEV
jgi:hypothetical protein